MKRNARPVARLGAVLAALLAAAAALAPGAWARVSEPETPGHVTVALFTDYLPISGLDLTGRPSGMLADIWRLWSEKTGIAVTFKTGTFAQAVEAVRDGRADIHAGLFRSPARADWFHFTRTLYEATSYFYFWRDLFQTPPPLADLHGRSIGVLRGTHQVDYLRESPLGFRPREFDDPMDMLRALARGEVVAVMHESFSMRDILARAGVGGNVVRSPAALMRNSVHAAVSKGRPAIRAVVDYGLSQITHAEFVEIEKRWIAAAQDRYFGADVPPAPTDEELSWLTGRGPIRIGILENWPPISFTEDGASRGITPAIVELIRKRFPGTIELVPANAETLLKAAVDGKLDGIFDLTSTLDRAALFHFTSPYLTIPYVVVAGAGSGTQQQFHVEPGQSFALERGFVTVEYVRERFPGVLIRQYDSTVEALAAVAAGEADAWAGNRAVFENLKEGAGTSLSKLRVVSLLGSRQSVLSVGTRKDEPILRDILEKAMTSVPRSEIARITEPWLQGTLGGSVQLSAAEQRWLARHRGTPIRVMVGAWPPFHYPDGDRNAGLALDYVRKALNHFGLPFEEIRLSWSDAYDTIGRLGDIDLLPTIAPSPDRAKTVAMTDPYLSFPMVVFTRSDAELISGLDDLSGRTVAVENDFIMEARLRRDFPDIQLMETDTTHQAIEAVSLGKADAYVGNLAAGTFHIDKHGFSNLKVAAPTTYADDEQAMGVRRDWPQLASLLNKYLAQLSVTERDTLRREALSVRFEYGVDWKTIAAYVGPGAAVLLLIIGVVVYANRKLREREGRFKALLESAPDAVVIVGKDGRIAMVNRQAELMFWADREQMIGQPIEILVPDAAKDRHVRYRSGFVTASAPREMGANLSLTAKRFDGDEFPVEISLSPIETAGGTLIAASVRDVTERRAAERKLADQEKQLREILDCIPDIVFVKDLAGTYIAANAAFARLLDKTTDFIVGKSDFSIFPEAVAEEFRERDKELIEAGLSRTDFEQVADTKGRVIDVETTKAVLTDTDGKVNGLIGIARDITARIEAQRELEEKDAMLTAALENMSSGIFMIDKNMNLRVFNRKFVDMYHFPDLKPGTPLRDVLLIRAARGEYGEGDPDVLADERLASYREGKTAKTEDTVVGGRVIEGFRQPLADGGMVCVFNDITVRKKAEEALAAQTRRLRTLSETLSRYLSPQIYEAIFAGASDASIRTERKKLTVFFSDIKDFTATTEEMEPEDMTFILNDYLTKMSEIALEYGGTIDKYIGDAIMVFFGDPETKGVKEDALAAVRMAVAMQRRMIDLRAKWADMGFRFPFHIRCGINTGYCNVGNFGSDQRIDYTLIGGQVNLAARLEQICEPDGVTVAYETYTHVRDAFTADPLEPIQVKGIKEPVRPYAIRGILEDWDESERYIRKDIQGMRLWVDLMRMTEEQRIATIRELNEALDILDARKAEDPAAE